MGMKTQNKMPEKKHKRIDMLLLEKKNVRSMLWFSMNQNIMGI